MAKSRTYSVKSTRCNDFIEVIIKGSLGTCIVHKNNELAIITQFVACGEKPELLQHTIKELNGCKIVAYVNHSDLRVFAEQGFEATDDLVPPPMGGYGIRQLTTRMIRHAS